MKEKIESLLRQNFPKATFTVENFSGEHAGHAGAGTETHFRVEITWSGFRGQTRVMKHRVVNKALQPLFHEGLHALQITANDC